MTNFSPLPESLKATLIALIGLVIALLIGSKIGTSDYRPIIIGFVLCLGFWLILFTGDYFWVMTVASASLAGTFPILGGSFTPFQMMMGVGVGKFVIEDVILRRRRIQTGPAFDRLMIFGFMGILTLHALRDRFGMRFLGSTVWGGRNYIN